MESLALSIPQNPFIFGRPVPPEKCIGRERLAQQVLGRLLTGGSSAIYGERRVGKTSFLLYLQAVGRQSAATREILRFAYLDAQALAYTGSDPTEFAQLFWRVVLKELARDETLSKHLRDISIVSADQPVDTSAIAVAFDAIAADKQLAVLLLDELEYVIERVDATNPSLLYSLRSVASRLPAGLALVTVSRQPLGEALSAIQSGGSSPFQNIFAIFRLDDFDEPTAYQLLDSYLKDSGHTFRAEDRTKLLEKAKISTETVGHRDIRYEPESLQFEAWKLFDERIVK